MIVAGQERIAALFGVAPKTIVEWQEQGFPVAKRGGPAVPSEYDAPECIRWLVDREVGKVRRESPKDRLHRLQADNLEMTMAERRQLLVSATAIEPAMAAAMVAARERLLQARKRLAAAAEGKTAAQIEALLDAEHADFLRRMSRWRPADADQAEDLTEDEPAGAPAWPVDVDTDESA